MEPITLTSPDQHHIQAYVWQATQPKAWVHINHGMAEHALRYERLAMELVSQGYSVVAHNHRGHGSSDTTILGLYATENGWNKVLDDITVVREAMCDSDLPYFLMGHSMGSFIVQSYLLNHDIHIDGLILSGSNYQGTGLIKAGALVAKLESMRLGKTHVSRLIQFLSFGAFNKPFKPHRTDFEWLSRDPKEVDKYVADPLCGFDCSISLWQDMFAGLVQLFSKGALHGVQEHLPMFIFGGDKDPVGQNGKGLPALKKAYEAVGQKHIDFKLYKDGRHEMLNETNRDEVMGDICNWVNTQMLQLSGHESKAM